MGINISVLFNYYYFTISNDKVAAFCGPVDGKRHEDLKKLFKESSAGLVFVTAFPNDKLLRKYITEIAWETEVWQADAPTHLIHFNGERFLGPYQ